MLPTHATAVAHLGKACPMMKALIGKVGPCALEIETGRTPFQALVSAVAHQQLHGKAAQTILGRYRALFGGRFPGPKALAGVTDDQLRGVGFSRAKTAAIRDLAEKTISGLVPGATAIAALSVLVFTFIWNDFFWATVLTQGVDSQPITAGLSSLNGQWIAQWHLVSAGSILAALPPVAMFFLMQKHFIAGLTLGAVK